MKLIITIETDGAGAVVVTTGDGGTFRDMGRESRPEPREIKAVPIPKLPPRHFKCDACGKEFSATVIAAQCACECGAIADLAKPPEDDTSSILCPECGKSFRKGTLGTGRQGTCPDCTLVRCPVCKNPTPFSSMKSDRCPTCRDEF